MKKFILILLLLPLFISNVYAVGSSGSTGGENRVYAKSVKIEGNPGKLRVGDKYTFKVKLDPSNASSDGLTWTSSDSNILSIDNKGNAVAKNKGTVKVTVKTSNGKTDSIAVTVNLANTTSGGLKKVKTVSITSYPDEIIVGNTFELQTKISPSLVDNNKLTFKSDNEKVLTVDSNGLVTAKKKGEATITVTSANNKTAKVTIKVVNAKVTLSKSSMTINEGETKEITVKIESNKQYSASDLKWATGNEKVTKVETISGGNNTFKAKVYGLSKGVAMISANIDGEKDRSKITVKEAGRDTSLECPLISYDTSDNEYIKINITPASTTDHFDYAVSTNGRSGSNAKWGNVETNIKGNKTFNSKYDSMQGKIRIFSKSGSSRDCYTAPFDYDSSKSNTMLRKYSGFTGICPTVNLNKNTEYISGAKSYKMKLSGNNTVTTGIKVANLTLTPADNTSYQYSWYTNNNGVVNYISRDSWQLNRTFNGKTSVSLDTSTNYNRQGLILLINEKGDIGSCYTDIYNNDAFKSKTTINGNTDIYVDKDYSYNSTEMINLLKSLPKYYTASSKIILYGYKNYEKKIGDLNSCGVANNLLRVVVRDGSGCDYDYAKIAIIHELGHSMDFMYKKINYDNNLSSESDIIKIYNKYINIKSGDKYTYLRSYSYSNKMEFWADLVSLKYLNTNSSFNNNSYKGSILIDSELSNLNSKYLKKIEYIYSNQNSDWNKYKDMYR